MAQLNPMLEILQKQIKQYNKEMEATIDKVATRQNYITIAYVAFNIIVFAIIQSYLGDDKPVIQGISNNIISLIATILLLLASFPMASKFAKKNFRDIKLCYEKINHNL